MFNTADKDDEGMCDQTNYYIFVIIVLLFTV